MMAPTELGMLASRPLSLLSSCDDATTVGGKESDSVASFSSGRREAGATDSVVSPNEGSPSDLSDDGSSAAVRSLAESQSKTFGTRSVAASAFTTAQEVPPSVASTSRTPNLKRPGADDDGNNLGPSPSRSDARGSSSKRVCLPLRQLAGNSSSNSNSPRSVSRDAKAGRDVKARRDASATANDEMYVFRLCLATEIDPSTGAIKAKDPSNTSYSAVDHINDGALETRWLSFSLDPVACMFYASEAIHKRGLKWSDLVLVEVKLNRNDCSVFDLSARDELSVRHREELGVSNDARAASSTRLLREVVVEGGTRAIVQRLALPLPECLPLSYNLRDFIVQLAFCHDEFEKARRPLSEGPRLVAPKVDHAANKEWVREASSQPKENLPELQVVRTSQTTLDRFFSNSSSNRAAASEVVLGTGKARIACLLSARREIETMHAGGTLPDDNFLLQQGREQFFVALKANAQLVLHLQKELQLFLEKHRNSLIKAGVCTGSQLGKRIVCPFTYPARLFDRQNAAHVSVLAIDPAVADIMEGVMIHLLDIAGRRANIRDEWEGTTGDWPVSATSPRFLYLNAVKEEHCSVPDCVMSSLYFSRIKEHQDWMRNAPPDAPRIADGSRRAPRNSATGEYHSNVNLGEGRRPAIGQVEDLVYYEDLKASVDEAVLFDAFEIESMSRLHAAIKESELALSLIGTDRFRRIKAFFVEEFAVQLAATMEAEALARAMEAEALAAAMEAEALAVAMEAEALAASVQRPLVAPEDRPTIAPFVYRVMEQLRPTRFSETDRRYSHWTHRSKSVGSICVECRHCAGKIGARKFFWSQASTAYQSFGSINSHVLGCKHLPAELRNELAGLKELPRERTNVAKAFFERVWARLHGLPVPPIVLSPNDGALEVRAILESESTLSSMPSLDDSATAFPSELTAQGRLSSRLLVYASSNGEIVPTVEQAPPVPSVTLKSALVVSQAEESVEESFFSGMPGTTPVKMDPEADLDCIGPIRFDWRG